MLFVVWMQIPIADRYRCMCMSIDLVDISSSSKIYKCVLNNTNVCNICTFSRWCSNRCVHTYIIYACRGTCTCNSGMHRRHMCTCAPCYTCIYWCTQSCKHACTNTFSYMHAHTHSHFTRCTHAHKHLSRTHTHESMRIAFIVYVVVSAYIFMHHVIKMQPAKVEQLKIRSPHHPLPITSPPLQKKTGAGKKKKKNKKKGGGETAGGEAGEEGGEKMDTLALSQHIASLSVAGSTFVFEQILINIYVYSCVDGCLCVCVCVCIYL